MKISKSTMHFYKEIVFFQGRERAGEGEYLFKESVQLFAVENLAVHLVEFEGENQIFDLDGDDEVGALFEEVNGAYRGRTNIIDIRLVEKLDEEKEVELYYTQESFDEINVDILSYGLVKEGGFNAAFVKEAEIKDSIVKGFRHDDHRYIKVLISEKFLKRASLGLSDRLLSGFDPKRYVDSNILIFFLMVTVSATGTAELD